MKVIKACSFPTSLQFLCCQALRKIVPSNMSVIEALDPPPGLKLFLENNLSWLLRRSELLDPVTSSEISRDRFTRFPSSSSSSSLSDEATTEEEGEETERQQRRPRSGEVSLHDRISRKTRERSRVTNARTCQVVPSTRSRREPVRDPDPKPSTSKVINNPEPSAPWARRSVRKMRRALKRNRPHVCPGTSSSTTDTTDRPSRPAKQAKLQQQTEEEKTESSEEKDVAETLLELSRSAPIPDEEDEEDDECHT